MNHSKANHVTKFSVLLTFIAGLFAASTQAFAYCDVERVDQLSVRLDKLSDNLHDEIHHMARTHVEVRRVDEAAVRLHKAAHHMHETAHRYGTCRHLERDWRLVKRAYYDFMRQLRYAHCLWHNREVTHLSYQLRRTYRGLKNEMEYGHHWDDHHGDHHPHFSANL